jgi:hypothetical protein
MKIYFAVMFMEGAISTWNPYVVVLMKSCPNIECLKLTC